jgi:Ca-activated chloride channel family protein
MCICENDLRFTKGTPHDKMNTLAQKGNGNAYYIDSLLEAKRVFVEELGSTLNTVAKDAKIQVEFNPEYVAKYRLIGFENKMLTEEEFEDSNTDAGEIGEGHSVIAIYEITLKEEVASDYIFRTKLRYRDVLINLDVEVTDSINHVSSMSEDFKFASCVAEFGLLLRNSNFKGDASYYHLLSVLERLDFSDDYHKKEFFELVKRAHQNQQINE